jgi:hypothetical protein
MTRAERSRLIELLGKHMNELHSRDAKLLVRDAGELLYGLGVHIHFTDNTFFIISSKG